MNETATKLEESGVPGGTGVAPAPQLAIRVEGVRKRYGDIEVLKGVDLVLAAGQSTAIMCYSACKFGSDSILMQTDRVLALVFTGESLRWLSGSQTSFRRASMSSVRRSSPIGLSSG